MFGIIPCADQKLNCNNFSLECSSTIAVKVVEQHDMYKFNLLARLQINIQVQKQNLLSSCGSAKGEENYDESGISKDEGYINILEEVEVNFFLASLRIYSRSGTPGCRGDEGFSRVPSFLGATVSFLY